MMAVAAALTLNHVPSAFSGCASPHSYNPLSPRYRTSPHHPYPPLLNHPPSHAPPCPLTRCCCQMPLFWLLLPTAAVAHKVGCRLLLPPCPCTPPPALYLGVLSPIPTPQLSLSNQSPPPLPTTASAPAPACTTCPKYTLPLPMSPFVLQPLLLLLLTNPHDGCRCSPDTAPRSKLFLWVCFPPLLQPTQPPLSNQSPPPLPTAA